MIRNWHQLLGYPALIAALFAAPAVAGETQNSDKKPVKLEDIKEQLDRMEKNQAETLKDIRSQISTLQGALDVEVQARQGDTRDLRNRIAQLEKQLKDYETRLNQAQARVSNFPAPNGAAPPNAGPPPLGQIRLVNSFGSPARVILNNVVYRLNPMEIRAVDVPLGPYTFEVLVDGFGSIQPATTGLLTANVPRTIEIFPR
jgi:hypothetical protein